MVRRRSPATRWWRQWTLSASTAPCWSHRPLLADYLEEGLSQLGYSIEDFEIGRM